MLPLSRLLITGPITDHTPKPVITEILFFHNVSNVGQLFTKKTITVHEDPDQGEFNDIAKFINPYEKWEIKNLLKAWYFIKAFMGRRVDVKWCLNNVGLQCNEFPYSLNACMLYRICLEWSLPMRYKTTIDDMIAMIKISFIAPKSVRSIVCLNIKAHFDDDKDLEKLNMRLENIKKKISKPELKDPSTNAEAIAISAIVYNEDITYSSNAIIDFYCYRMNLKYNDTRMLDIYNNNRDILNLKKTFNPIFPLSYYKREILISLSNKFGFVRSLSNLDMYINLQFNHTTNNFYYGWQENLKRDTTAIEFEEVSGRKDIICYGNFFDGFLPYTYTGLSHMYSTLNGIFNPDDTSEELPPRIVTTLLNIANKNFPALATVIKRIKMLDSKIDDNLKSVLRWYLSISKEEQNHVYEVLDKILKLGMYMRGWKGENDIYPLKDRPYDHNVDVYTTQAFFPLIDEYKNVIGRKILNLPPYRFSFNTWKRSRDKKDGLTIHERLIKVKNNPDIYACIRMSSNWLIWSAYKYMVLFGYSEPFNPSLVENIQ